MVFFTCASCGESLKKNAVEKHLGQKCKSAKYVTCMDCSKDFWGKDYAAHVSCVTEAEKYGDSSATAKDSKGKLKQEKWIQNLKDYVSTLQNIDSSLQAKINTIISYENVPKKEQKFKNFLTNSLRIAAAESEKLWEIFEGAKKTAGSAGDDNAAAGKCNEAGASGKKKKKQEKKESLNEEEEKAENTGEKKSKKKKKIQKEQQDSTDSNAIVGSPNAKNGIPQLETGGKKSKKRKMKGVNPLETEENGESVSQVPQSQTESKKSKKRKMKGVNLAETEENSGSVSLKKSKLNAAGIENPSLIANSTKKDKVENTETVNNKSKRKKRKHNQEERAEEPAEKISKKKKQKLVAA